MTYGLSGLLHRGDDLLVGRVNNLKGLALLGGHPLAVDEKAERLLVLTAGGRLDGGEHGRSHYDDGC